MTDDKPLFILAGNGPYLNLGCEAIVRGTVKILRAEFNDPNFVCLSHFKKTKQWREQSLNESDDGIVHLSSHIINRNNVRSSLWKPETWKYIFRYLTKSDSLKYDQYRDMLPYLNDATAVLSIGGDNYSIDFGIPKIFTDLDDIVLAVPKPLSLWGASIGPFDSLPKYEEYMSKHLRFVDGIFARESITTRYLQSIGVSGNTYSVADPAFVMDPTPPKNIDSVLPLDEDSIGVNLSPLIARFITGGDNELWARMAASIIVELAKRTEMPIYLIPHVTVPESNDYDFLRQTLSHIPSEYGVKIVPQTFSASEMKWIISKMKIFAGARTHATIASISSCVPTLSVAYSQKAHGINQDIFGHQDYIIESKTLSREGFVDAMIDILDNSSSIKSDLMNIVPGVERRALIAGKYQKEILMNKKYKMGP